jgi:hypothetical protein
MVRMEKAGRVEIELDEHKGQRKARARRGRRKGRDRDGSSVVKRVSGEGKEERDEREGTSREGMLRRREERTLSVDRQRSGQVSGSRREGPLPEGKGAATPKWEGRGDTNAIQGWRRSSAMQRTIIHVRSDRRAEGG